MESLEDLLVQVALVAAWQAFSGSEGHEYEILEQLLAHAKGWA